MSTKKEIRFFSIMEYEKEQEYLRAMHRAGWQFVKVCGLCVYHFQSCAPEDVVYQLDFNQEGLANKELYVKMFRDCGWDYLQDYMGYSYFRKPAALCQGEESIFCDDESRLQMMKRVFQGRLLPLLILFSGVLLPQFILQLSVYQNPWLIASYGIVIGIYLSVFLSFTVQYKKFKDRVRL